MLEPAPGLFSTTTGWPSALPNSSLITRATKSAAPPGAKPTSSRIGLFGYPAACAQALHTKVLRANARNSFVSLMGFTPWSRQRSGCNGHAQHDLSDMAAGFHVRLRIVQSSKVDHPVDPRLDASGRDMRHHVRDEAGDAGRALRLATKPVGDAKQCQPLGVQGLEVQVRMQYVIDISDRREPAFEGQRADVLREDGAAEGVHD